MLFERNRRLPSSLCLCSAGAVAAAAIAYRLATFSGFSNDHYMHLAWAQQVLRGAVPGRDFVEPGMPLVVAFSAMAQRVGGQGLLAELVLCLIMLAASAGLTCWLAARFTGSLALGVCAAGLQIAIFPRLYNYPKLIVPLVALALLWRYLDRPTVRRAALVGAWLAAGFLFRHDYLVYLGLAASVALLLPTATHGRRTTAVHTAACALTALVVVLPYLAALQSLDVLRPHARDGLEFARGEDNQWRVAPPWFAVANPQPVPDREALAPAGPLRSLARSVVFDVALPLAPLINAPNAGVVLYYGAFALPAALLVALLRAAMRRRPRAATAEEAQIAVLAVLALSMALGMVRHPIDARLPDVSGPMPLVLVAVAAALRPLGFRWRVVARIGIGVAVLVALLHGAVWNRLYATGAFRGPAATAARYGKIWSTLHTPPWDDFWPAGPLPKTIRYLRACTTESDRVLVTWFAPEVFTFAERGFAAGHSYFIRRAFYGLDYQRQMLERLEKERVPVALVNLDQGWFRARFQLVQRYLDEAYTTVGTDRFQGESVAVAIRRNSTPTGVYPVTGWPCFR